MPYIAPEVVHFSGNTYTYTTRRHDSLKISNGKWMWWSQSIGGRSTLDYLIKIRGFVKGLLRKQCLAPFTNYGRISSFSKAEKIVVLRF